MFERRAVLLPAVLLSLALGALAQAGCIVATQGGLADDGPDAGVCRPATEIQCPCPNEKTGYKTCGGDGTYGACVCASPCVPGRSESCQCPDFTNGARVCPAHGSFGPCVCGRDDTDAGPRQPDGGTDAGSDDFVVNTGSDTLVDLFPTPRGLIVVRSGLVELLGPDGARLTSVTSPREITAAAFDGTMLGVADRAMLTVYDADLQSLASVSLLQSCASAVIVSGSRFVCGPANDWERVFSIYSMTEARLIASSDQYTYNGIPMRRVPGTDDFVSVTTNSSPSDYHLYRVNADSSLTYMGESPYHGDFAVTETYAFDSTPAVHLINPNGIVLRIYNTNCDETTTNGNSCFQRDGELGTLAGSQMFISLADDGAGTLYGVVADSKSYSDGLCTKGCSVHRIDMAAHLIRAKATLTAKIGKIVASRFDPTTGRFVVGYMLAGKSSGEYAGYRIERFLLE